jgi:alpha-tubulin suppressor-like RCC1 family protein
MAGIKTDGTLWTWGQNTYGQLGIGATSVGTSTSSPVQTVASGTNWKTVSCGTQHTYAIKTDGTLWTWGTNAYGQLGDNTIVDKNSPVQTIAGGTNWKSVSTYQWTLAGIKTDGTLWLSGRNQYGQLGDSTLVNKSSPIQTIAGGTNWKQVSPGNLFTAAIKTDGTLWLWGFNGYYNFGDGTNVSTSSPVQVTTVGSNWKTISSGLTHLSKISDIF